LNEIGLRARRAGGLVPARRRPRCVRSSEAALP
jgi:hypothetical protein